MNVIVVIPARGGSKEVPRKNLRPLCGKPLIYYSIKASLSAKRVNRVAVTTDDAEISMFAERFGASVIMRPGHLATDSTTIDPVVAHAVEKAEKKWGEDYDLVMTVQPTSPLIKPEDIDAVVDTFVGNDVDTVISAVDDRHLCWKESDGRFVPSYAKRLNRQLLPPNYRETGAIIACKKSQLKKGTRVGEKINLHIMEPERSIDIDSKSDFWLCEHILNKKEIVITVIGKKDTGLGHAFRAVMIAHELINFNVTFLCEEDDSYAYNYIVGHNYEVKRCRKGARLETILSMNPDMVINDILDTSADYIMSLKKAGIRVVNFEDMGLGSELADLCINALYPHQMPGKNILVGPKYFCLRDEFLHAAARDHGKDVRRVLVTFGGVDEGDLTSRVLRIAGAELVERNIHVDVILGPGYAHHEALQKVAEGINSGLLQVIESTPKISDYMIRADAAITSAGRTVMELAAFGVPTIVICQNLREVSHKFASSENGIINLGLRSEVKDMAISDAVWKVVSGRELRETMRNKITRFNLSFGKKRVIERIAALLRQGKDEKP